jgi:hypothetical protein
MSRSSFQLDARLKYRVIGGFSHPRSAVVVQKMTGFVHERTGIYASVNMLYQNLSTFEPMLQSIIVVLLFLAAVVYAGRLVYKTFFSNAACSSGCGKCGAVDFRKIEQQLKQNGL